jgi:rhodanese-related sulfurtransferase
MKNALLLLFVPFFLFSYEDVSYKNLPKNIIIIDVRTTKEFTNDGRIPRSINIPLSENLVYDVQNRISSKKVAVVCRSGHRSSKAAKVLEANGYIVYNIDGGVSSMNYHYLENYKPGFFEKLIDKMFH